MTDADRTDKAEERENMYIMMFTLQSLQNYGLSVKKTVERSLDYLWEWYQESGEERYLLRDRFGRCSRYSTLRFQLEGDHRSRRRFQYRDRYTYG